MTATAEPPRSVRAPMVTQAWRDLTFLHWPYEPEELAHLVPEPFELDLAEGAAWISVVAFSTTCRVAGAAPLPGPRRFPETNVRTYVRAPDGGVGLWFLSLDVTNRVNVWFGRALGLPYHVSDMSVTCDGALRYEARRRDGERTVGNDVSVTPRHGDAARDAALDVFLTGRWCAYVKQGPLLLRCDVEHPPWPLVEADLLECEDTLVVSTGAPAPRGTPRVHYSPGIDAKLAWPRLLTKPRFGRSAGG